MIVFSIYLAPQKSLSSWLMICSWHVFVEHGLRVHFTESGWTGLLFLYKIKHDRRSFCVEPSRMGFFKVMNGIFQNDGTRKDFWAVLIYPMRDRRGSRRVRHVIQKNEHRTVQNYKFMNRPKWKKATILNYCWVLNWQLIKRLKQMNFFFPEVIFGWFKMVQTREIWIPDRYPLIAGLPGV